MDDIFVRELMPQDAEALIAYTKRVGGETDNLSYGAEGFPVSVEGEQEMLAATHDDPRSQMLGAWRSDTLIAVGSLFCLPRRMSHRAELGISVVRAEWNKGIGGMLTQELIAFAKGAGIEIINLEVRSDNVGAIHLYEKLGFRHIGCSPAHIKVGSASFDAELMYLDLR